MWVWLGSGQVRLYQADCLLLDWSLWKGNVDHLYPHMLHAGLHFHCVLEDESY